MSQSNPTDNEQAHRDAMNAKNRLRTKLEELATEYGHLDKAVTDTRVKALHEDLEQEKARSNIIRLVLNTERSQLLLLESEIRDHLSKPLDQRKMERKTIDELKDGLRSRLKELKNRYSDKLGFSEQFIAGYQQGLAMARDEIDKI